MRILLTNDDGFFAPGISSLYEVLSSEGGHEIYIVAPEGQRSATGRSITIFQPLFVTPYQLKNKTDFGLAVNGTPTDCVKLAIQGDILPQKPDLLIAGINEGPNLGTDVFYSGTVAAAMEGVLLGIPSIAVSLADYDYENFYPSAYFIKDFIIHYQDLVFNTDGLLNINFPGGEQKEWTGVRITKLGKTVYHNDFERRKAPYGKDYFWISGNLKTSQEEGTDLKTIQERAVSITPLHGDLSDYKRIKSLQEQQFAISLGSKG